MTSLKTFDLTTDGGAAWTVQAVEGPAPDGLIGRAIASTVPGEVHTDLLAVGVIPDPFDGDNESALHWIGRTRWSFRTTFSWVADEHERQELVAEGLDTVATVTLNGQELGRTANQHRSYRFDVTGATGCRGQRAGDRVRGSGGGGRGGAGEGRQLAAHQPAPVQRAAEDGLELRLGLGTGRRHRGHLAADPDRVLVRRTHRLGPPAGGGRRRSEHLCLVGLDRHRRRVRHGHGRGRRYDAVGDRQARVGHRRRHQQGPRGGPLVAARVRRATVVRRDGDAGRSTPGPAGSASGTSA